MQHVAKFISGFHFSSLFMARWRERDVTDNAGAGILPWQNNVALTHRFSGKIQHFSTGQLPFPSHFRYFSTVRKNLLWSSVRWRACHSLPFWCSAENHVFTLECTPSHCQRNGDHRLRNIVDLSTEPLSLSNSTLVWKMTQMKTRAKDTFKMCRRFWSLYTCMNLWNLSVVEPKCCHGRRIMVQNTGRL